MLFVVTVTPFNGQPNRNGKTPVYLNSLNGELPDRARVLDGTIAERSNVKVGETYALSLTQTGNGDYGPTYRHLFVKCLNFEDIQSVMRNGQQGIVQKTAEVLANQKAPVVAGDETF